MLYWKYNCQVGGASHSRNVKCAIVHTQSLFIFNELKIKNVEIAETNPILLNLQKREEKIMHLSKDSKRVISLYI